jgi:hypothetical protein
MKITNCTCPKCQGTGKIDFSDIENGICFKCNGEGYIGEMPLNWIKTLDSKKWRNAAKDLIINTLKNLEFNGKLKYTRSYEMYDYTIESLIKAGYETMKFRKNIFWQSAPNMTFILEGANLSGASEYSYQVTISDKIEVKCIKSN